MKINFRYEKIKALLEEYERVKSSINPIMEDLMSFKVDMLDAVVLKGTYMTTWNSLLLEMYFTEVQSEIQSTILLINDLNDVFEVRIKSIWTELELTELCKVPDKIPWDVFEFVEQVKAICAAAGPRMNGLSQKAKEASFDLIEMFQERIGIIGMDKYKVSDSLKDDSKSNAHIGESDSKADGGETTRARSARMNSVLKNKALGKTEGAEFDELLLAEFSSVCTELINVLHNKTKDVVLKCVKHALDNVKKRLFHGRHHISYRKIDVDKREEAIPFFFTDIHLEIPTIVMKPPLDSIQHELNSAIHTIIQTSAMVIRWHTGYSEGGQLLTTMSTMDHKDVLKVVNALASSIQMSKAAVQAELEKFNGYEFVWSDDKDEICRKFLEDSPMISDFNQEIQFYVRLHDEIDEKFEDIIKVDSVALKTALCKESIKQEISNWTLKYARTMNDNFKTKMVEVDSRIGELTTHLNRHINDLDDVRCAMISINEFKQEEIWLDTEISKVEDCYSLLNKLNVPIPREEMNMVDTLRYGKQKMANKAQEVQYNLMDLQPTLRGDLISQVAQFKIDAEDYVIEYNTMGPMVEGIVPKEASSRLIQFSTRFEAVWARFITYSGGEELFGLTVTDYPDVQRIKKELGLLQKLYSLYNSVINAVQGYYDIVWNEVDIEAINAEIVDFQNR